MTNRINHTRFNWFLAFTLLLTLLSTAGLTADDSIETKVALRPAGTNPLPVSTPTDWTNPGYPTDIYRPDLLHGPPVTTPVDDRQSKITGRLTLIISKILSSSSSGVVARRPTAP